MTFLLYAVGLLFVGMVAVFVALPLLTAGTSLMQASSPEDHADQADRARWEKQKTDAYAAIKEAEFDKQMGKLTEEDYQLTRRKYDTRAVEALMQLDRLAQSGQEQSKKG